MYNVGDILFQLFSLMIVIFFIVLIVRIYRSIKQRRIQLDRIEKKLDTFLEQVKKDT